MKVAIPVKGRNSGRSSFSKAKYFIIVEREESKVKSVDTLMNPYRHLRRSANPLILKCLKIKVLKQ